MRIVAVRLTLDDFKKFEKAWKKTTCRKLSDYHRLLILKKPVTVIYRNQSMDDFMAELIQLRTELNAIGQNYNQVVKRLHTLDAVPDIQTWLLLHESARKILLDKVAEIKSKINQINDVWLAS